METYAVLLMRLEEVQDLLGVNFRDYSYRGPLTKTAPPEVDCPGDENIKIQIRTGR